MEGIKSKIKSKEKGMGIVFDATAHIGCDTILFAKIFPEFTIRACEIDKAVRELLVLNTSNYENVEVLPANDSARVLRRSRSLNDLLDVLFIDPPWLNDRQNLSFGGKSFADFLLEEASEMADCIVAKLPHDTDLQLYKSKLKDKNIITHEIRDNRTNKLSYYLLEIDSIEN